MSNIAGGCCGCGGGGQYVLAATGVIRDLDFADAGMIIFTGQGSDAVEVVNVYGLKAGRAGQVVSILNGTNNGIVWLQHGQALLRQNQLWNKMTKMATPLGSNGSAIYQYSDWDQRWHLLAHAQGFPVPYDAPVGEIWGAFNEPPPPAVNSGAFHHMMLVRETAVLISIDLTYGPDTFGSAGPWFFRTPVPSRGDLVEAGAGYAGNATGNYVLSVTYSPSWAAIVASDATNHQPIDVTNPFVWTDGDVLRMTLEINVG